MLVADSYSLAVNQSVVSMASVGADGSEQAEGHEGSWAGYHAVVVRQRAGQSALETELQQPAS